MQNIEEAETEEIEVIENELQFDARYGFPIQELDLNIVNAYIVGGKFTQR